MVTFQAIQRAGALVRRELAPTPLIHSEHFSRQTGAEVLLKLENLQRTGSFKIRGALNYLHCCRDQIGSKGVVAASAGNHAQGVALAAQRLGLAATVVMPEFAPISKQLATRDYGGEVVLHGDNVAEALTRAQQLADEGYTLVHPFDDPHIIAGQGTVGLEVLEQLDRFDQVWVPVGGGGLAAGIALAVHQRQPRARVVGVQAAGCPSAQRALAAGKPVSVTPQPTIADGIAVPQIGRLPLQILAEHLAQVVTVDEGAMALAMVQLLEKKKLVAEGAGASALAALLNQAPERIRGQRIVVVISGGNVDLNTLDRILETGLMRTGRLLRLALALEDRPGALAALLGVVAEQQANVLHVAHDRLATDLPLGITRVHLTVETRDFSHHRSLAAALRDAGYRAEIPADQVDQRTP